MPSINDRLTQLGIELPAPMKPGFEYVAVAVHGHVAYVSGQLPWVGVGTVIDGKVGAATDLQRAQEAARVCTLYALANLQQRIGRLDDIEQFLKITGFVASAPGFVGQPKVIDAASKLLVDIFGDKGRHARSAVGVAELPRGASVEIEMIVAIRSQDTR